MSYTKPNLNAKCIGFLLAIRGIVLHKPSVMLSALFMLLSAVAVAGEKVNSVLDVEAQGTLYIENTRGQLQIEGWDKPQIMVQGELDDAAKQLFFKRKGPKSIVKVVLERGHHGGDGSRLKIFVPQQTFIRFRGINTDYSFANFDAKVEGETINGAISLDEVHGKMVVSSVSGGIKVANSSGVAVVESVSGKVDFSGQFDKAQIKSMSGNIIADIGQIQLLLVENVTGNTAISGQLQNNAKVNLNSVSGHIRYVANKKFTGKCEVASQFGGQINNQLTTDKPWKEMLQQRKLKFESGDGTGKLTMNTVSGSVILEQ